MPIYVYLVIYLYLDTMRVKKNKSTENRCVVDFGPGIQPSWPGVGDPRGQGSHLVPSWRRLGSLLGGLRPRKVANMGPNWLSKCSPNR